MLFQRAKMYEGALTPALEGGTDLVPAQYEGGLMIWECSEDLVRKVPMFPIYHWRCIIRARLNIRVLDFRRSLEWVNIIILIRYFFIKNFRTFGT